LTLGFAQAIQYTPSEFRAVRSLQLIPEEGVSTLLHLLLACAFTLFLAYQARSLAFLLRSRWTRAGGRPRGPADLFWTCIPVLVVLFLAARSWVAVFDPGRPAIAFSVTATNSAEPARPVAAPPMP
jgi:heme/copper-type cytochrome/quinol oxidase subunit 2